MRQKGRRVMDKIVDKRQELFTRWEEKSREFVGSFIDLFGRDGRLVSNFSFYYINAQHFKYQIAQTCSIWSQSFCISRKLQSFAKFNVMAMTRQFILGDTD